MKNLEAEKRWYMNAVEGCLILRGMNREEALLKISEYKLQERLDKYPEIQMHYDIEATVEEILDIA